MCGYIFSRGYSSPPATTLLYPPAIDLAFPSRRGSPAEVHDVVAEKWIMPPGTPRGSFRDYVSSAWIQRKYCFQMRRVLARNMQLLGTKSGNADHADIAIAPRLLRDPFDQVVTVPLARTAAVRFADAAGRADDMDVTARDEKLRIARFERACPEGRPGRLRRQRFRNVRTLKVLIVDREREQRRKLVALFRTVMSTDKFTPSRIGTETSFSAMISEKVGARS